MVIEGGWEIYFEAAVEMVSGHGYTFEQNFDSTREGALKVAGAAVHEETWNEINPR